ncbi:MULTISPECIES: bifunctional phosphopantothenoylcysteine decarboxylase/phosphopantothenate--cysteine ligase CoaBC [unclassified Thermosipho (in: thermotogales)]|uniref:bifunctional phosphopantothenoylcysteine decarboxylase/phosphopantothenate--cysteine ligase CoaBC n=1 Tax=unclassified Thermosipho (in: thermotogales) TaxID=2676525 RepID=UPI0009856142|nr:MULTISPECIES: bifunctional phosphopantothenoylcysteine decarboxylase/phosphopantothenate--cysteine ligase CoaBC [unclassified Thermosipho (in: thermotogales)]MBT1247535.1 phosphopantothenoylcysteine decarboxylase [Thermosipho sp. 1244]OOC46222.1 phosphopantothenoylcysteine decarboxylase [Thermosipho sp. 1223]
MPHILLGVSSGIAIYKTVDLVSKLRKENFEIDVIMSENATKLISPSVFSAVGNCNVYTDTYQINGGYIIHTELSKKTDIFLLAPATANTIAKIANGFGDNLLTTTAIALPNNTPKVFVPTMNTRMYENKITLENIQKLKKLGWYLVEPETGHLACGDVGKGRYPENSKIIEMLKIILEEKKLNGKKILITAGPTQESIDPIRYITNHSSGKMGYALTKISKRMGAYVTLISGPTNIEKPYFIDEYIEIRTADEMYNEVVKRFKNFDIVIMTAAVADYTPVRKEAKKIKKANESLILELKRTKDILKEISIQRLKNQVIVGFAAETENIIAYGKEKLEKKQVNYIIANNASKVMGSNYSEVFLISKTQVLKFEGSKEYVAKKILDTISSNI